MLYLLVNKLLRNYLFQALIFVVYYFLVDALVKWLSIKSTFIDYLPRFFMREILFAFLMLTPIYFFRKKFEPHFKWKFKALKPDISLLLILITVIHYFGISSYLTDVMPNVNFDGSVQFFYPNEISDIDFIFMVLVVAPILEELLFTGIILDGFLKKYNPTFAILVYALIFGASHFNVAQSSQAFVGALVSGYVYYRTKNLSYTILIHFVNNLMIFPGIYFKILQTINESVYLIYLIIACSLLIYFIIYLILRRRYSKEYLDWRQDSEDSSISIILLKRKTPSIKDIGDNC